MENKYYTPDISDIRVGYKCEFTTDSLSFEVNNTDDFSFRELDIADIKDIIDFIEHGYFNEDDLSQFIRTPYLTKEQIEEEGWKEYETRMICRSFKKENDYHLYWFETDNAIQLCKGTPPMWLNYYYSGECPSINEFRTISKLLNI